MRPVPKSWSPVCGDCGHRHHGSLSCEQVEAAAEEVRGVLKSDYRAIATAPYTQTPPKGGSPG